MASPAPGTERPVAKNSPDRGLGETARPVEHRRSRRSAPATHRWSMTHLSSRFIFRVAGASLTRSPQARWICICTHVRVNSSRRERRVLIAFERLLKRDPDELRAPSHEQLAKQLLQRRFDGPF